MNELADVKHCESIAHHIQNQLKQLRLRAIAERPATTMQLAHVHTLARGLLQTLARLEREAAAEEAQRLNDLTPHRRHTD